MASAKRPPKKKASFGCACTRSGPTTRPAAALRRPPPHPWPSPARVGCGPQTSPPPTSFFLKGTHFGTVVQPLDRRTHFFFRLPSPRRVSTAANEQDASPLPLRERIETPGCDRNPGSL